MSSRQPDEFASYLRIIPRQSGTRPPEGTYSLDAFRMGLSMAIDAFAGTRPLFLPEQFSVGQLEGWAVLESLVGGLLKRATITGHGVLDADTDTVVFIETYSFDVATATRCIGRYEGARKANTPDWKTALKAKR